MASFQPSPAFYERLVQSPDIPCDTSGSVRYDSTQQLQNDPRLNIGEKVNIHQSLASLAISAFRRR
jgi:hypothetical protein